jgi:S-DNA-T family DNA segregation ATPase FtsK/SpoIIIE
MALRERRCDVRRILEAQSNTIEHILATHRAPARVCGGTVTPRWVRFQILPAQGVRIAQIEARRAELAAGLDVPSVRLSQRGAALALEVPRDDPRPVRLLPMLEQLRELPPDVAALGLAEDGHPLLIRLPSPDVAHMLVAGTTGSGKTVLLQAIVLSLALFNSPDDLRMVLIDPKRSAFSALAGIPHLARPVIRDVEVAAEALASLVRLMERRSSPIPRVVVVIDELADLLMVGGAAVQMALTRLTQRGREAGIHLVAATQKPASQVIGTLVKANFPVRLVGHVLSVEDARVATGWPASGAERLLGRGDFLAVAEGRVMRFQAAHVTAAEIESILHPRGWSPTGSGTGLPVADSVPLVREDEAEPLAWEVVQSLSENASEASPSADEVDEVALLVARLERLGWDPDGSYRSACRLLGEAEGGRRFPLVQAAVERYRATATGEMSADDPVSGNAGLVDAEAVADQNGLAGSNGRT